MLLDLRRPTLVITGIWNPAVFQPGWIALHLFGRPKGEEVQVTQAQVMAPNLRVVNYFGEIGIGVTAQRVEFYLNNFSIENKRSLENVCIRTTELLPHTPMDAIGVNFIFNEADPDPALIDKLKTRDDIEIEFEIVEQIFLARVRLQPD